MNLQELIILSAQIEQRLSENGGEIDEALSDLLVLADKLPSKIDAVHFVQNKLEFSAEALKARADEYRKASDSHKNAALRLQNYVKLTMLGSGQTNLTGERVDFRLSSSAPKLVIENESQIDPKFFTETVVRELSNANLKEALLKGEHVKGARLEPVYRLTKKLK